MIRPCSVARVAGGSIISDSSHLSYKQKCTNETVVLEEIAIKMKNEEKEKKKTKTNEILPTAQDSSQRAEFVLSLVTLLSHTHFNPFILTRLLRLPGG